MVSLTTKRVSTEQRHHQRTLAEDDGGATDVTSGNGARKRRPFHEAFKKALACVPAVSKDRMNL